MDYAWGRLWEVTERGGSIWLYVTVRFPCGLDLHHTQQQERACEEGELECIVGVAPLLFLHPPIHNYKHEKRSLPVRLKILVEFLYCSAVLLFDPTPYWRTPSICCSMCVHCAVKWDRGLVSDWTQGQRPGCLSPIPPNPQNRTSCGVDRDLPSLRVFTRDFAFDLALWPTHKLALG